MSIYGGPFPQGDSPWKCSANGCEARTMDNGWLRCQGASPDTCTNRLCPDHETRCMYCSLPVCEQHCKAHYRGKGFICDQCLDHWSHCHGKCGCERPEVHISDLAAMDDDETMMALARAIMDDVQRDMASQPEAEAWAGVAAAGRQPHWWLRTEAN